VITTAAKRPMSIVVDGLPTKTAKILALIAEGYDRAETHRFLGVRYQFVRNVLENAGIRDGLQNGVRSPAPAQPPRAAPAPLPVEVLVEAGFFRLGIWRAGNLGIELETRAPKYTGVYAFAIAGRVMYVGVTHAGFHKRMGNYAAGSAAQATSSRINIAIAGQLAAGVVVEIYLATPEPTEWNGLPVNTAAGLEEGLIRKYSPPWNMRSARG